MSTIGEFETMAQKYEAALKFIGNGGSFEDDTQSDPRISFYLNWVDINLASGYRSSSDPPVHISDTLKDINPELLTELRVVISRNLDTLMGLALAEYKTKMELLRAEAAEEARKLLKDPNGSRGNTARVELSGIKLLA